MHIYKSVTFLIVIGVVLIVATSACVGPKPEAINGVTETTPPQTDQIPSSTPTRLLPTMTLIPTSTPIPPTPTLAPSPTPVPTKQIFLVYYGVMGDGIITELYDGFMGVDSYTTPNLIIYTDGQLLRRQGSWFIESQVSVTDMCDVYSRLEELGFFQEESHVYNLTPTPDGGFPSGGPASAIEISGAPVTAHSTSPEDAYLVQNYLAAFDFVANYQFTNPYHNYWSDRLLLWIERVEENVPENTEMAWPDWTFDTPLDELLAGRGKGFVFIQGKDIYQLQPYQMSSVHVVSDNGNKYVVLSRSLLPHESPEQLSDEFLLTEWQSMPVAAYAELPFTCSK